MKSNQRINEHLSLADLPRLLAALKPSDIPTQLRHEVRITLLDTMAAALAAQGLADVRQLTSVTAGLWPGSGSIWWNRATASMPDAAFVNAFASHCLDFDSVHYGAFGHPAVVILPALLAAFEVATGPGEDVICSYLVGAEVMAELAATFGLALQERGLHSTPILGCLAVAAALGWFLKLDQPGLESAFTLASVGASGFVSSFGSISKSYQVALACRNGLVAAQVARAGVWVGGDAWLQNLVVLSGVLPQSAPIRPFGRPWAFEEVSTKFKRYPVCGYFQQVLDRLAAIVPHFVGDLAEIAAVRLDVPRVVAKASRYRRPSTVDESRFSLPFSAAATLTFGRLGPDCFREDVLTNPTVLRLIDAIEVVELDDAASLLPGGVIKARITVRYRDGNGWELELVPIDDQPSSEALVAAKFRACAGSNLRPREVDTFIRLALAFDNVDSATWRNSLRRLALG